MEFLSPVAYLFQRNVVNSIQGQIEQTVNMDLFVLIYINSLVLHGQIQKILSDGALITFFLNHQHISKRAVQTSPEKKLGSLGPITLRVGSVPVFPRKPIATYEFPGTPVLPSGSAHVLVPHYITCTHPEGDTGGPDPP